MQLIIGALLFTVMQSALGPARTPAPTARSTSPSWSHRPPNGHHRRFSEPTPIHHTFMGPRYY